MDTDIYPSQLVQPWRRLARLVGLRFIEHSPRRATYTTRLTWGEVTLTLGRRALGAGLELIDWSHEEDDSPYSLHVSLPLTQLFVRLPRWLPKSGRRRNSWDTSYRWGFSISAVDMEFPSQLHLNWGSWYKILDLPWSTILYRRSYLLATGRWYSRLESEGWGERSARIVRRNRLRSLVGLSPLPEPERPPIEDVLWDQKLNKYTEQHPYCYVLKSGEAQDVIATLTVDEREIRRRWLRWTPLLARVRRSINVSFSQEVGERAGSYKGGVVGASHDMLPGEFPVHTLRRMQEERRFH